jgi:hypothetical protein
VNTHEIVGGCPVPALETVRGAQELAQAMRGVRGS